MEIEAIQKTQTEEILEMENLGKRTGITESSAKKKVHSTKCPGKETGEILH